MSSTAWATEAPWASVSTRSTNALSIFEHVQRQIRDRYVSELYPVPKWSTATRTPRVRSAARRGMTRSMSVSTALSVISSGG